MHKNDHILYEFAHIPPQKKEKWEIGNQSCSWSNISLDLRADFIAAFLTSWDLSLHSLSETTPWELVFTGLPDS